MSKKRRNKTGNQRSAYYLIASLLLFAAVYVTTLVVNNCSGGKEPAESKWNKVNADDSYVTGSSAEGTKSISPEQAEMELQMQDAPSEGLSQTVYENLEQPAPLVRKPEMLLMKTAFIISYNVNTLCPNYVAWKLTPQRVEGRVKRKDEFGEDLSMGESTRVTAADYAGSGYDRGHMCPAGDNKHEQAAMNESFLMTNVCPQNHNLNKGDWNELELQCRQWAEDYGDLYIVCGPIFDSKNPAKIGRRKKMKVCVPDRFFKVVLSMGDQPKAIGFIYPNQATSREMRSYCVSVNDVEKATDIDFYPQLPDDVERRVERACNPAAWGI
ncbi:MAG: DNA/RNA non-specific endonuclease [Bacteroidaceae bacterium]|nr:DNA/RNA non-specific endonuclease [Bacteroidaceae bacterium]